MDRLTFSQTPPTEPGLYWFTQIGSSRVYHCDVWRQERGLTYGGKLVAMSSDSPPKPVERFRRWWAGPLPPVAARRALGLGRRPKVRVPTPSASPRASGQGGGA
ncbi:hypothetical protein LCGC14_0795650 [marine sediment metagenome]|uniref:Uncharacterized protein n=1 Tax=marine sediment metagenome TaxID=412755 RepID=A0A0F9SBB8_9ZZZZ